MKKWYFALGAFALLLILGIFIWSSQERAAPPLAQSIQTSSDTECPYTFVSWNIANLGKHNTPSQLAHMAKILAHADIVAVQEVTARKGFGAKAVAALADELSRTGAAWDYIVSDATEPASSGVERYAFLFKRHVVSINRDEVHLVGALREPIDREPFTSLFRIKGGKEVRVFTIHTVPTAKVPIREVQALGTADEVRTAPRAFIAGDFNLDAKETDGVFAEAGYVGHIRTRTSLKKKVDDGRYLAMQYDNIYSKGIHVCTSGIIDFVERSFSPVTDESLARARELSDHLPVFATFK